MKKYILLLLAFFTIHSALSAQSTLPPEMVFVEGGVFTMGCTPEQQPNCYTWLNHVVRIPSFEIGKFEVTQEQWETVMGFNPGTGVGTSPNHPVYFVNFYDCTTFCNRLSKLAGLDPVYYFDSKYLEPFDSVGGNTFIDIYYKEGANGYRLPTEAEWEYAARAVKFSATQTKYCGSNNLDDVGWYGGNNTPFGVKLIGQKSPNALGLYDMSGNVYEWCYDFIDDYWYNPCQSPIHSLYPIIRGGSWAIPSNVSNFCAVSARNSNIPGNQLYGAGFNGLGLRLCKPCKY